MILTGETGGKRKREGKVTEKGEKWGKDKGGAVPIVPTSSNSKRGRKKRGKKTLGKKGERGRKQRRCYASLQALYSTALDLSMCFQSFPYEKGEKRRRGKRKNTMWRGGGEGEGGGGGEGLWGWSGDISFNNISQPMDRPPYEVGKKKKRIKDRERYRKGGKKKKHLPVIFYLGLP